jgi:radical SAM protein with 4Fe4S-binding SPASM domain
MKQKQPVTLESIGCDAINLPDRNYYDYSDELERRLVSTYDLSRVYQLELHPGLHCDLYRCPHCYGHGQQQMSGCIGLDTYVRMFDDVRDLVSLVQFGGVSTEPTTHPEIAGIVRAAKQAGFICGMHTKGYRLDASLRDVFTRDPHERTSFITFSLDASQAGVYRNIHQIATGQPDTLGVNGEAYFERVVANIRELYALREERQSGLRINIAYLLMEENRGAEDVARAVSLFEDCCDVIRFSFPHARNDGVEPDNFIAGNKRDLLASLRDTYVDHPKVRILENTIADSRRQAFAYCFAQIFQAVVDKAGNVFPCPQTALRNYHWLAYGNVVNHNLSQLLLSEERAKLLSTRVDCMKCRICDRKDEAINIRLNGLFGGMPCPD